MLPSSLLRCRGLVYIGKRRIVDEISSIVVALKMPRLQEQARVDGSDLASKAAHGYDLILHLLRGMLHKNTALCCTPASSILMICYIARCGSWASTVKEVLLKDSGSNLKERILVEDGVFERRNHTSMDQD